MMISQPRTLNILYGVYMYGINIGISLKYMCCLVTSFRNRLYFSWQHISWIKSAWNEAWFDVKLVC